MKRSQWHGTHQFVEMTLLADVIGRSPPARGSRSAATGRPPSRCAVRRRSARRRVRSVRRAQHNESFCRTSSSPERAGGESSGGSRSLSPHATRKAQTRTTTVRAQYCGFSSASQPSSWASSLTRRPERPRPPSWLGHRSSGTSRGATIPVYVHDVRRALRPHVLRHRTPRSGVLAGWSRRRRGSRRWRRSRSAGCLTLLRRRSSSRAGILMSVVLVAIGAARRADRRPADQDACRVCGPASATPRCPAGFWSVQQLRSATPCCSPRAPGFVAGARADRPRRAHEPRALGAGLPRARWRRVGRRAERRVARRRRDRAVRCPVQCSGLAYLAIRKLSRTEHPLTIMVWFAADGPRLARRLAGRAGAASLPRDAGEVAAHLGVALTALAGQITS